MYRIVLVFLILLTACQNQNAEQSSKTSIETPSDSAHSDPVNKFAIVIHGGAGTIKKENMTPSLERAYTAKLTEAVRKGHKILDEGGSAGEAVEAAIRLMEDSPLFNSGKGAVFTNDRDVALDASFMDGNSLNAGAIAGVKTVKNPISLARKVLSDSEHVLLAGDGADAFAKAISEKYQNIEIVPNSYFHTQRRLKSLERTLEASEQAAATPDFQDPFIQDSKYGTVGCVALDRNGNIAAGTSTGGMTNKKYGRVGDSPIIGAGTYANNNTCGVSSTGHGEYFIRNLVAYDISAQMEYADKSLQDAAADVIQNKLTDLGGTGGVIALDHLGNIVMEFNTAGMYRASMDDSAELTVKMYKD